MKQVFLVKPGSPMVEVFKTNVRNKQQSQRLLGLLSEAFPACRINFDLTDRDKVLRVEGIEPEVPQIIRLVKANGFHCERLV